ncbi:MAG: hypothetical protein NVS9B4_07610 [Candidatus Acidiferrum sp.]
MIRLFFLALALVCAGLAARRVRVNHLFDSAPATITAQILPGSVSSLSSHPGSPYVKYSFTLPDGRTFTNSQGGYSGTAGDTILVEYVRNNPGLNRVAGSGKTQNRLVWIFAVPAVLFLLIAARLKAPPN